jgi:hypothetical protein
MEFEVSQSEDRPYLIVTAFEALTADIQRRMMQAVAERMAEQGIKAVLVDVSSVRNVATVHENFNFANYEANQLDFPRHSRVAILVDPDDHSHNFIETVFQNAGYSCRIFQDEDSAIEWLTAQNVWACRQLKSPAVPRSL